MINNTPLKDSESLLHISFTLCFCSIMANHLGSVIEVVRSINLNRSVAAKSNFPYHKVFLS